MTATSAVPTVTSSVPVQAVGVLQTQTTAAVNAGSNNQVTQQDSTTTTTVTASDRDDHFARPERLSVAYNERSSDSG